MDLETSSRVVLDNGVVLTRCDQCRIMYAERTPPQETPCDGCRVELRPENEDAATVFLAVQHQLAPAVDGRPLELSVAAIKIAMDLYGVREQRACFEKVQRLWPHVEGRRRKKGD